MIAAAGTTGGRCPGVGPRSGLDSRIRREDSPLIPTAIRVGHNRLDERSSRSRSVTSAHIVISSNNFRSPNFCALLYRVLTGPPNTYRPVLGGRLAGR